MLSISKLSFCQIVVLFFLMYHFYNFSAIPESCTRVIGSDRRHAQARPDSPQTHRPRPDLSDRPDSLNIRWPQYHQHTKVLPVATMAQAQRCHPSRAEPTLPGKFLHRIGGQATLSLEQAWPSIFPPNATRTTPNSSPINQERPCLLGETTWGTK